METTQLTPIKHGAVYARVSTEEQAKEGFSIQVQIEKCLERAISMGVIVPEENIFVDEGKTATNMNRDGLIQCIAKTKDLNIKYLFVLDTDRLARDEYCHFYIKRELKKNQTTLLSVNQPIDDTIEGSLLDTVLSGVNAFQSRITGRKVSLSMQKKVEMGGWAGVAPLGYKNVNIGTLERPLRVIQQNESAPLVKEMFYLYAGGSIGLRDLTDVMNKKGLRSRRDNQIARSVIAETLRNPVYYGQILFKKKLYEGKHEPLISKDLWDKVQDRIDENNRYATRTRKYTHFHLRGFLVCNKCGRKYTSSVILSRVGKEYYECNHNFLKDDPLYHPKKGHAVPRAIMDDLVADLFKKIEFTEEIKAQILAKAKEFLQKDNYSTETQRVGIQNKIQAERQKLNNLLEDRLSRVITGELFYQKQQEIETRIKDLEEQLVKINDNRQFNIRFIMLIADFCENIYQAYCQAPQEMQKRYIKFFFNKIYLEDRKIVNVEYTQNLLTLIKNKQVLLSSFWLPGLDSNQ